MIKVVQAFDGTPITELKGDDAAALERKMETARRLYSDRASWLKPHRRMEILRKLAALMEGKREHLGRQIAREGGKPLTDALIEVDRAIDGVRYAADELSVMAGSGNSHGTDSREHRSAGLYDSRTDRDRRRHLRVQPPVESDRASGGAGCRFS
jgi:acyl-CoA reductase-like NAD-dependent aldehyde dehydrogenase